MFMAPSFSKGVHKFDPNFINLDLAALEMEQRNALEKLWRMKASLSRDLSETDKAEEGGTQL